MTTLVITQNEYAELLDNSSEHSLLHQLEKANEQGLVKLFVEVRLPISDYNAYLDFKACDSEITWGRT